MSLQRIYCVVPSIVVVGECFEIKVKLIGANREISCANSWNTKKPTLHSPYNLAQGRKLQYIDNTLPEWTGELVVEASDSLAGPNRLVFDGENQGVFVGDKRPIKTFSGLCLTKPGFHFIKLTDPETGISGDANPIFVTTNELKQRVYWGDPHWQTFMTDGLRCPEELYAFARDEAFLNFGAISDHMEGLTDRQWDYFQLVTNDFNVSGRFVTLIGQEWTNHSEGHRNVYVRGDKAPVFRSDDPAYSTLPKLWRALDELKTSGEDVLLIPHHTSNVAMGCDWSKGWNPEYEKVVEIYSLWGSSECHADDGNLFPLRHCCGEMKGRHVVDALDRGYRFGFIGGGDIHDGRPGDSLAREQPNHDFENELWAQGFTAVKTSALTRENIFDAIKDRHCYASTKLGLYLDVAVNRKGEELSLNLNAASQDGLLKASVVKNGVCVNELYPKDDARIIEEIVPCGDLGEKDYVYIRVVTKGGDMAWSSPVWADAD